VPTEEVDIESGIVRHPSGKRAGFGELAARAGHLPVPDDVRPKDPGQYKLIGREGRLRVDAPGKILGTTRFTIDVTLPRMLTAVVLHPPSSAPRPPQSTTARRWPSPASPPWSESMRASR
jgi:isoquinoline 1-oxidoreductase subunit beta